WIGEDAVARAPWPGPGRRFVVTDETVAAAQPRAVGAGAADAVIAIPPGEQQKTLATAERIWTALVAAGATRADHVAGVGGGVVGDLAGFCAATYQRGVPVVHVPTTIVAQVDSAYGGTTGVDLPEAKNYVGAYHQPAGVLVDPGLLATLPPEERAAAYAEVVKTALIARGRVPRAHCRARDSRAARDLAARGARSGLRRGRQDRAHRGRAAVGAGRR